MRKIPKKAIIRLAGVLLVHGLGAEPRRLSPEGAVSAALAGDARLESANWDWLSAQAKAREAEYRKLPTLSLSAGCTRLSDLQESLSVAVALRSEGLDPLLPRRPDPVQRGTVEFHNVSFTYFGAEHPALQDISFTARAGETTAIIGSTGSGKTTLLSLIPRFYDATAEKKLEQYSSPCGPKHRSCLIGESCPQGADASRRGPILSLVSLSL